MFQFLIKLTKDLFTEDGSKWSLTRLTSTVIVAFTLGWVTFVIRQSHTLPDLTGPTLFVGGGAAHLGIGKWSEFAKQKLGIGAPPLPGPPPNLVPPQ